MLFLLLPLLGTAIFFTQTEAQSSYNPTILQDSRDLPKTDGRFGFLYRTEDGISHGAVGEPGGQVHGRFTYTDPTGLKVNYNYNAGSRVTPGYNYNSEVNMAAPPPKPVYTPPQTRFAAKTYNPPPVYDVPLRSHARFSTAAEINDLQGGQFNYRT